MKKRCEWPGDDPLYIEYHDREWGVPVYNDDKLFEFLILEGMQTGLSWITILKKRGNFRKAFDQFNPREIVKYGDKKIQSLLNDKGIIRNKLKINATISNAKAFLEVQKKYGSFSDYMWQFIDSKPVINKWKKLKDIPANTPLSDKISKDMKQKGFKFVGKTIIYSHMQATGMVNDHIVSCFRYRELS